MMNTLDDIVTKSLKGPKDQSFGHWYNESGAGVLTHLADGFKSAAPSPIGVSLEEFVEI